MVIPYFNWAAVVLLCIYIEKHIRYIGDTWEWSAAKGAVLLFMNFRIVEMRYVSYHSQKGHDLTLHNQLSTNSKRGISILISKFQGELKRERTHKAGLSTKIGCK